MKRFATGFSIILVILFSSLLLSCSKDDGTSSLLPSLELTLKNGSSVVSSIKTNLVTGISKNGGMTVITGTDALQNGQKAIIYLKNAEVQTYDIDIKAADLLNFNLSNILNNTVIYQISENEYYLIRDGSITISKKDKNSLEGSFTGTVFPGHLLTEGISLSEILNLFLNSKTMEGTFKVYNLNF